MFQEIEEEINKVCSTLLEYKYCDVCDIYLDSEGEYDSHLNMKLRKINIRTIIGDLVRDGRKHRCTQC